METPKSGSSRHTSRLKRTRSTISRVVAAVASPSSAPPSKSAPCRTSTPSSKEVPTSNHAPVAAKEDSHDDEDDDYLLYPGTQYEDGIPEIIWVDEASPRTTRAMLRKRTDDAWLAAGGSSDELTPKPKPKPATAGIIPLPTMSRRQPSEVEKENAIKGRKAIEELEQIYKKMLEEEEAAAAAANTQGGHHKASSDDSEGVKTSRSDKTIEDADAFCDSGDDSFLCKASQIVERAPAVAQKNGQRPEWSKIKFPPAPATMLTPAAMPEVEEDEEDPFADGMDSLLSQIDVSAVPRAQEKSAIVRPPQSGSKMLLQTPPQQESGVKRRCNSAEAGTGTPPLGWKGIASMPRCATSPDSHRPPGLPGGRPLARCTQEEIERKKQEAMRRRKQKNLPQILLVRKK